SLDVAARAEQIVTLTLAITVGQILFRVELSAGCVGGGGPAQEDVDVLGDARAVVVLRLVVGPGHGRDPPSIWGADGRRWSSALSIAQTTFTSRSPTPSMWHFITSPFLQAPTPAGVPVKNTSPGFSSQNFDA